MGSIKACFLMLFQYNHLLGRGHKFKFCRFYVCSINFLCPRVKVSLRKVSIFGVIQSECGKIRSRITPNTDTFYAVCNRNTDLFAQNCIVDTETATGGVI